MAVLSTGRRRVTAFVGVGVLGFLVQIAVLAALTAAAHWAWLPATIVAVEAAVLHNFVWHQRWTWRDRRAGGVLTLLLRFHVSNGLASFAGNTAVMTLLVEGGGLPAVAANVIAVAVMSGVNFLLADRWVFGETCVKAGARCALVVLVALVPRVAAAQPEPATLHAWQAYIGQAERTLGQASGARRSAAASSEIHADGQSTPIPSGTITDWQGSIFIPGIQLDRLLQRLQHPGTPPPQEDVVSSRVLGRDGDSLRVAIRLVRRAIVTVTYDTEHRMDFRRVTPTLATARSVATRIEEVGGDDHGFLWRLQSYWRYEQRDGGVQVDLRSVTLSRNVPALVRPVAAPLVNRIARESIVRTLDALRRYMSAPGGGTATAVAVDAGPWTPCQTGTAVVWARPQRGPQRPALHG